MTRQVICHHCYEVGHNIRTCSKFAERAKNNPDSWISEKYERMKENSSKRVCSFCLNSGHNKATCNDFRNHKFYLISKNAEHRKLVLSKMKENGIGLGTLIERKYEWESETQLLFVQHIVWDNILFGNQRAVGQISIIGVRYPHWDLSFDLEFFELLKRGVYSPFKVVMKAEDYNIGVAIPMGWETGISNIDKVLETYPKRFKE